MWYIQQRFTVSARELNFGGIDPLCNPLLLLLLMA
jgi:hypothetical protein